MWGGDKLAGAHGRTAFLRHGSGFFVVSRWTEPRQVMLEREARGEARRGEGGAKVCDPAQSTDLVGTEGARAQRAGRVIVTWRSFSRVGIGVGI